MVESHIYPRPGTYIAYYHHSHIHTCFRKLTNLESLPNRMPEDQDSINLLKKHLQGGTNERGGTLQNYMARMAAENNPREYSRHPSS
jgi:hypothetical protein